MLLLFHSSHIFVSWFLVFWSLKLRDFLSVFFRLAHLALQNVNKDYVIFSYFRNFVAKSDQRPKTKTGKNETHESVIRGTSQVFFFAFFWWHFNFWKENQSLSRGPVNGKKSTLDSQINVVYTEQGVVSVHHLVMHASFRLEWVKWNQFSINYNNLRIT